MRRLAKVISLALGVILGYGVATIAAAPEGPEPATLPAPGSRLVSPTTTLAVTTSTAPQLTTYLVWSTGGLTEGLVGGLTASYEVVSIVVGDLAELDVGEGRVVPLDAIALDPPAHAPFDPTGSLADLVPGSVALGESSSQLRNAGTGDELIIEGSPFRVVGVVPNQVIGAAEVVFHRDDPSSPVITHRYALVSTDSPRQEFEAAVRSLYDGPAPLRIRAQGETPWLRHGDAVLPQVLIKEALGEFSYTERNGVGFEQDPEFLEDNIVTEDVPILGRVMCHRVLVEMLRGAMRDLIEEGLSHLVDPGGYGGCWNPRFISPAVGRSAGISRHAWGAAVDINSDTNPIGSSGSQDPRLIQVMLDWGFTWGGDWLVPDPMHFEYGVLP